MKEAHLTLVTDAAGRSDDTLMGLAQAGDERAFAEIVQRHELAVRRVCSLMLFDREVGRDAAQEVFLRLWKTRARYRPEGKLKPLLLTIARNHCKRLRYRHKLQTLFVRELQPVVAPESIGTDTQRIVQNALQLLPEKFRLPLVLRFVDELEYEDIAAIIGRTPSATRSRIHYGLKELGGRLPKEIWP